MTVLIASMFITLIASSRARLRGRLLPVLAPFGVLDWLAILSFGLEIRHHS
jgi:hypothetical protein